MPRQIKMFLSWILNVRCGRCFYKIVKLFHNLTAKEQLLFSSCQAAHFHPLLHSVSANLDTTQPYTAQNSSELFMHVIHIALPHHLNDAFAQLH